MCTVLENPDTAFAGTGSRSELGQETSIDPKADVAESPFFGPERGPLDPSVKGPDLPAKIG